MEERWKKIFAISAFLAFWAASVAVGGCATISSYTSMQGEGVIDRDLDVQTDMWYEGQKFTSTMRTPYLGIHGTSVVDFSEEIFVLRENESEIAVEGKYTLDRTFHRANIRSYAVGSSFKIENVGAEQSKHMMLANQNESAIRVEGSVTGTGDWCIIARDPDSKLREYRDDVEYDGSFYAVIEYGIERVAFSPDVTDWLGCP
jgi:hypothetical protein